MIFPNGVHHSYVHRTVGQRKGLSYTPCFGAALFSKNNRHGAESLGSTPGSTRQGPGWKQKPGDAAVVLEHRAIFCVLIHQPQPSKFVVLGVLTF